MPSFEDNTHGFLIRIWLEPRENKEAAPEWRGVIEHIPGGQRRYVKELGEITAFIALYLKVMGIRSGLAQQVRKWSKRKKLL